MQLTFEDVLKAWTIEYNGRLPTIEKERRNAFLVLLNELKDHGYGREELDSSRREKIIVACVNQYLNDKKKLKAWIRIVANDLKTAMIIFYGNIKVENSNIIPETEAKLYKNEQGFNTSNTDTIKQVSEEDNKTWSGLAELEDYDRQREIDEAVVLTKANAKAIKDLTAVVTKGIKELSYALDKLKERNRLR